MGKLIDETDLMNLLCALSDVRHDLPYAIQKITELPPVEAIPKDNVYKALQEMMKYEHEGFINISLARLDGILKECGVSEDEKVGETRHIREKSNGCKGNKDKRSAILQE